MKLMKCKQRMIKDVWMMLLIIMIDDDHDKNGGDARGRRH